VKMHQTGSAPLALLALLVLTLEMSSGQSCPRSCNCYQANEVHCTFRSLLIIPPGLNIQLSCPVLSSSNHITIHQGGQVHLECQADGVPAPLLSWVLPNRSTLTSSGVYRCVASNSAGAASASVRLHVSSLPPVIQQPREEHLLFSVGWPVYAHCSARGAPTPILRWRIPDGTLVRPSQFLNGNLFVLPNGTLHIRNVGSNNTGNYECTASNAVGTTKRTVTVAVKDGEAKDKKTSNSSFFNKVRTSVIPSQTLAAFSSSPFNSSSSSSLEINKTVKPYPSHFPDIKKANPFSVFSPSTVPTNNTKVSPRGNSTRVASSFHTSGKTSTVLQPQPVSPFTKAHIVSTSPSTTTVNYEGTLNLYCSVSGNPTPTIVWRTPTRKLVDMHYRYIFAKCVIKSLLILSIYPVYNITFWPFVCV
uniref:Ig-like domain-containing protein n=1 Tax=Poecilia reticulata TaxID=8081 RepID=A0A3P9P150_POERE